MQPLVSIVIMTYNASEFVLDALESAMAQTYANIELVVTDDGSKDNTCKIISDWIDKNKSRFVSTKLLQVEKNTGIAANLNRGVKASAGEFLKVFAGDDILLPSCIEENLAAIGDCDIVISEMKKKCGNKIYDVAYNYAESIKRLINRTPQKRHKSYVRYSIFLNPPAWFIRRKIYETVGYYDETIPFLDDQPMICKILQSNLKLKYIETPTIVYRISQASITNGGFKLNFKYAIIDSYKKYRRPYLHWYNPLDFLIICEMATYTWVVKKYKKSTLLYAALRQVRLSERIVTFFKL